MGSPPWRISSLPVSGFFQRNSELCSAWVAMILMPASGPKGNTTPPLLKRGAISTGITPSVAKESAKPAGAYTGALFIAESAGASAIWSKWAWVSKIKSTLPRASSFLNSAGVLGLLVSQGSMTMTLPPGLVIFMADWPSHCTATAPPCAAAQPGAKLARHSKESCSARARKVRSAAHSEAVVIGKSPMKGAGTWPTMAI